MDNSQKKSKSVIGIILGIIGGLIVGVIIGVIVMLVINLIMNPKTTTDDNSNNTSTPTETIDSEEETLKNKYSFDLSQIDCVGDDTKCERLVKVYYNGSVHEVKVINLATKKNADYYDFNTELYIDGVLASRNSLLGGDMTQYDVRTIGGNLYVFDGKYLGYLTPKFGYGGQDLRLYNDVTQIKNICGDNCKYITDSSILAVSSKTGFFDETTNESIKTTVEFDGSSLNYWVPSDGFNKLYKVSVSFDGSKIIAKKVEEKNNITAAGTGCPCYSDETNTYLSNR